MTKTVRDILDAINKTIFLPAIQRDFIWSDDRIYYLFDSLLREFPVGTITVWNTYEQIQHRDFLMGDVVREEAPSFSFRDRPRTLPFKLVLDGQQRLQALYLAFRGQIEGRTLHFDILSPESRDTSEFRYLFAFLEPSKVSDINRRNILNRAKATDQKTHFGLWVPVPDLWGMRDIRIVSRDSLNAFDEPVELGKVARENLKAFRSALSHQLHVSELDKGASKGDPSRKTLVDIFEIFVRINTQQTRLSRGQLIFSTLKLEWKGAAVSFNDFLRRVNRNNGLDIDTDFVVRCLLAVSDMGARLDLSRVRGDAQIKKLKKNFPGCCAAIESVIDFVSLRMGLVDDRLVGGINTLVPFVYYAFRCPHNRLPTENRTALEKAVFLLAQTRAVSRYADSRTTKLITEILESQSYEAKPLPPFPYAEVAEWVAYLEGHKAVDEYFLGMNEFLTMVLMQGVSVAKPLEQGNKLEVDHIYPQKILKVNDVEWETINSVANKWLLPQSLNRNKSAKEPRKFLETARSDRKVTAKYLKDAGIEPPTSPTSSEKR